MVSNLYCLFLLACFCQLANAQFNFFEQMFGGGGQQQQQQQRGSGTDHWRNQADAISCSSYLCPNTLVCVANPTECPCPHVEDIKCLVPDAVEKGAATVVCVRGESCGDVARLISKKWT